MFDSIYGEDTVRSRALLPDVGRVGAYPTLAGLGLRHKLCAISRPIAWGRPRSGATDHRHDAV